MIKKSLRESQKKKKKVRWKGFEYMIQTVLRSFAPLKHTLTQKGMETSGEK